MSALAVPTPLLPAGTTVPALVDLAETAARRAGAVVRDERPHQVGVAATKSSPTDVVTEMDRAAEELLRAVLQEHRPQDALLGEEAGLSAGHSGLTWVLDPIDGTVNYLYGIPAYAVSVAVVSGDPRVPGGWAPVAGCVHNPVSGETWTAGAGVGAALDGVPLRVGEPPDLAAALVGTGFGYLPDRRRQQAATVRALLPQIRDIRRIGAASLDLCLVATGRLDAYYERGLHPWDMAAAALVVTEAGGVVAGIDGYPPGERMVVAAAEPLCGRLVGELEALDAGTGD
jgi:myo-inositol-1(or 4)-monophosphatase